MLLTYDSHTTNRDKMFVSPFKSLYFLDGYQQGARVRLVLNLGPWDKDRPRSRMGPGGSHMKDMFHDDECSPYTGGPGTEGNFLLHLTLRPTRRRALAVLDSTEWGSPPNETPTGVPPERVRPGTLQPR